MPVGDYDALREEVGGQFVDASEVFWKMRLIKSRLEEYRIRKAVQITGRAMEKGFELLKEGMTEAELSRSVMRVMMEEGADFPSFIEVYAGRRFGYPDPASARSP